MTPKQIFKTAWMLIFAIISLPACDSDDDDHRPKTTIDKVIVNNEGEITFQDSLTYIVYDSLAYQIKLITNPEGADIYYSKNTTDFLKWSDEWISIDSTVKTLKFYAQGEGYRQTKVHNLDFGYGNDSLISGMLVYPNPFIDSISFGGEVKNIRGRYNYKIHNLSDEEILNETGFIAEDKFLNRVGLDSLPRSIYSIQFEFGNTKLRAKILKQ